jgi:inorganic pyrophosphatase
MKMAKRKSSEHNLYSGLPPFNVEDALNVIIDTPQKSRNKFKYDEELGIFKLAHVLTNGAVFPFDFGFVPSTKGQDGDPLDVLLLMDEPTFAGCLVPARLIGVIEAEQTENGKAERNDRLIAVAVDSRDHADNTSIHQLSDNIPHEIEHFFVSYNAARGREFKPLGRHASERARKLVELGSGASATSTNLLEKRDILGTPPNPRQGISDERSELSSSVTP